MCEDHVIKKLAAYVMLGINADGKKEVISLQIGENESSKYWLGVLNELKTRGVEDIMVICADGLAGIKKQYLQHIQKQNTKDALCIW